jgi:hypothetical protein
LRKGADNIKPQFLQKDPAQREKNRNEHFWISSSSTTSKTCRWRATAKPTFKPWIGSAPLRTGSHRSSTPESLHLAPSTRTPWSTAPTPSELTNAQIRRTKDYGEGKPRTAGPESCEHGQDGRSAAELKRDQPREGKTVAPKSHSDFAATSTMPPSGHLLEPTLCTRQDPGFPHPPAAEAANGGRGNWRIAASEMDRLGDFKKCLSATIAGERRCPRSHVHRIDP